MFKIDLTKNCVARVLTDEELDSCVNGGIMAKKMPSTVPFEPKSDLYNASVPFEPKSDLFC